MLDVVVRQSHVVLDACCIINLAPTGQFDNILGAIPAQFAVASYVLKREVITYIRVEDGQEIPIDLDAKVRDGLILEVDIDYSAEAEPNLVVVFEAQNLDPGEADSAAIAINRGWAIATDDRKAISVISQTSSSTQILTTPELIKYWADERNIPEDEIRRIIRSIRKYVPPNHHPLVKWWKHYL